VSTATREKEESFHVPIRKSPGDRQTERYTHTEKKLSKYRREKAQEDRERLKDRNRSIHTPLTFLLSLPSPSPSPFSPRDYDVRLHVRNGRA
jgi:hypothetical protein